MSRPPISESRILDAAAELFGELGYQGTTTAAIAERAGINEVTLFRRFGSKQGILASLAENWSKTMAGTAVQHFSDDADIAVTLTALAELELDGAERYGITAMRLVMEAAAVPEISEVLGSNPHDNLRRLAEYLERRQNAGAVRPDIDAVVMAEAFFAMTSTQAIANRMLGLERTANHTTAEKIGQIVSLFCKGILTGEGSQWTD